MPLLFVTLFILLKVVSSPSNFILAFLSLLAFFLFHTSAESCFGVWGIWKTLGEKCSASFLVDLKMWCSLYPGNPFLLSHYYSSLVSRRWLEGVSGTDMVPEFVNSLCVPRPEGSTLSGHGWNPKARSHIWCFTTKRDRICCLLWDISHNFSSSSWIFATGALRFVLPFLFFTFLI